MRSYLPTLFQSKMLSWSPWQLPGTCFTPLRAQVWAGVWGPGGALATRPGSQTQSRGVEAESLPDLGHRPGAQLPAALSPGIAHPRSPWPLLINRTGSGRLVWPVSPTTQNGAGGVGVGFLNSIRIQALAEICSEAEGLCSRSGEARLSLLAPPPDPLTCFHPNC